MKLLLLYLITSNMSLSVSASASSQTIIATTLITNQTKDVSLMQPSDIAYADAMEFARFLNEHGFTVRSVHRSKLEGFFRGVNRAAFLRTDKGIVEVILFSEPGGAEKIQVIERNRAGRYIYSFLGQPDPKPGDVIDASRPVYFIKHRNWLIVIHDQKIDKALKQAFA